MRPVEAIKLPDSFLGDDRYVLVEHVGNDDISLAIWDGDKENSHTEPPENCFVAQFAHGSEVTLIACMAGYYKRLGISNRQRHEEFEHAAATALAETADIPQPSFYNNYRVNSLLYTIDGEPMDAYDLEDRGWSCLHLPIPSQPGATSSGIGTGVYTRGHESGELTMVLARFTAPPRQEISPADKDEPLTAELCRADIPRLAKAVCDLVLGEYQKSIVDLVHSLEPRG